MTLPPPTSYQKFLADFVVEHKLHNLVETGLGVSTLYLLDALDRMDAGHLTSIDPAPWFAGEIPHGNERWTWMQMNSQAAFEVLPKMRPEPWDLFLHDSDHDVRTQTFEFRFAWGTLREGGWLACDDHTWGGHGAWRYFCEIFDLTPIKLDSLEMIQRVGSPVEDAGYRSHWEWCMERGKLAEDEWLANGGKNSDAFAAYRKDYK